MTQKGAVSEQSEVVCAFCDLGGIGDLPADEVLVAGACLALRSIRLNEDGMKGPICVDHARNIAETLAAAASPDDDEGLPAWIAKLAERRR